MESQEFKKLEGEYKFLSRARERLSPSEGELGLGQFIIVDLETTGLDPVQNEIIEIGALKTENGEIKDIFNRLVRPDAAVSQEIENLTGISSDMLEGCQKIDAVLREFIKFIGPSDLVVHNADFDIAFLKDKLSKNLKIDLNNQVYCTLRLSRAVLPNLSNHKLHTVAQHFQVPISGRHRAIGDCEATFQVWVKLLEKLKAKNVSTKEQLAKFVKETEAALSPF